MAEAHYRVGDVFERLAEIPDGSVDLVLTSPPFLALRSYLPADHPLKAKEIGSEPTPAAFLDTLLALTAEWRRVLAPHGSICVELGDTYAGSGGAGGDYYQGGWRDGQTPFDGSMKHARIHDPAIGPPIQNKNGKRQGGGSGWPLDKSLCGIPHLYHLSLAYGRNLLTGEPSPAGQWRVRNVVAWVRPNPPVGALGDKFRPATSYMTVACVSGSRYFDLDAVREPFKEATVKSDGYSRTSPKFEERQTDGNGRPGVRTNMMTHAGAPPLDWWEIPTAPYKGSHYATWPPALCTRPILSMCPQRVCRTCGKPSERITSEPEYVPSATNRGGSMLKGSERIADGVNQWVGEEGASASVIRTTTTLGWTDCGHDDWRPGLVLDPFAGSGTTLTVATGHGRDAIGIDLDARNADLARERVGMFLEVDSGTTEATA